MSDTLFVVIYSIGGYAREDADQPQCGGVYTDITQAQIHAKIVHGRVAAIALNHMPAGILASAKEFGMIK